ncbi:MAG: hypothetical protein DMF26_01940 [Verrucomicrobia bacterium]|nr:MAG: hypothetical protein DMF26_01940 [Verrucomicrobiota bacterium]
MQLAAIDPFNYRQIELFCLAFSSEIQRSPAARLDEAARFHGVTAGWELWVAPAKVLNSSVCA